MFNTEHAMGRTVHSLWRSWDYLLYSSVYLSLAAAAMAYVSCAIQGTGFLPVTAAIMFLITFSVYNQNRKTDEHEDAINHSARYSFTKKFENPLYYSSFFAYGFALVLASLHGAAAVGIALLPLVSGIAYSVPLLPKGFRYRRLKEIPVMKNLIVGAAWAIPSALLPAVVAGTGPTPVTALAGLFFFTLVFVNSTLFDMRDIEGDAASGVKTIPVLFGIANTTKLLSALTLVSGAGVLFASLGQLPPVGIILLATGFAYAQVYILSFRRVAAKNILCDLVADGQFIVFAGWMYCLTCLMP